ncbi:hypothetical protein [Herbaspirillum frisingense]|uniref:DUF2818 family protein n=1 Tax=Herbaspirillum frisingense TaxID=92645 RepID=A0ABU1PHV0_9BURK|nr:hypothetical protein [Herbaspirillum frisingense]MDR6585516.1 hypothetical protein [Herbaspirillum frisingense]
MNNYLLIINLVTASLILVHALCALNKMTPAAEHHFDRLFFSLVVAAESGILLGPLFGYMLRPEMAYVVLNVGFAGLYAVPWLYVAARDRMKGRVPWTSR